MDIHQDFVAFIEKERLCERDSCILLAISGGMDSMLMLHLFASAGYRFAVAHCNFTLRGDESDADEQLVKSVAKRLGVPFYVQTFDTEAYARRNGISIQMAARDLRYEWLEELCIAEGYDHIAVAHHLNDSLETALLNWVRGTGLAGMRGILPKRDRIIRPLLFATRERIETTVKSLGVDYREDESNRSAKYARNKIRMEVVPALKVLNPDLEHTFAENVFFFSESLELLRMQVANLRDEILDEYVPGRFRITRQAISSLRPQRLLLSGLLQPFGFSINAMDDLLGIAEDVSGKEIPAADYVLYVDREYVFIHPRTVDSGKGEVLIDQLGVPVRWGHYEFVAATSSETAILKQNNIAQFDAQGLSFPLRIRAWKIADSFRPLGMNGAKKLSDYFVSIKVPVFEKSEIPIVTTADGQIVWVAPHRMDDRFKITDKTKNVITLTCSHVA